MIAIDNVLVSDEVIEAKFVCDLNKCKGGCCEDGDAGAPLSVEELEIINNIYDTIKPYLTPEGIRHIERNGRYNYDREYGWVTPTVNGGICAYGHRDDHGIIKCGIEQAYREGKIEFKKPISCHLYPIIVRNGKNGDFDRMNYEPRDVMCKPACQLGRKLKVPVYEFLKEPLLRRYGPEFYEALEAVAKKMSADPDTEK